MSTEPSITPKDALSVAQQALKKANEVDDLRSRIDDLETELASLRLRYENHDENRDYSSYSLGEKVDIVRQHGYEVAQSGHGKATLTYKNVMHGAFNGEPGAKHCYKLMRMAAGVEPEETGSNFPGFTFRDPDGGTMQLAVDAERAKAGLDFFGENKNSSEGAN